MAFLQCAISYADAKVLLTKRFPAFTTYKWFFSSVYSPMTMQTVCCSKLFAALTAHKRFFSSVYFHLSSQISSFNKLHVIHVNGFSLACIFI